MTPGRNQRPEQACPEPTNRKWLRASRWALYSERRRPALEQRRIQLDEAATGHGYRNKNEIDNNYNHLYQAEE